LIRPHEETQGHKTNLRTIFFGEIVLFLSVYTLPLDEAHESNSIRKGKNEKYGMGGHDSHWRGNGRERERERERESEADPTIVVTPQNVVAEGNCVFSASTAGSYTHSGAVGPGQNMI
jgi:hypothetical protein